MSAVRERASRPAAGLPALLATGVVTAVVGGTYLVVDLLVGRIAGGAVPSVAATAAAALVALPTHLRSRRLADRRRAPDPPVVHTVLAELAALPRVSTGGVPDLSRAVETVARELGAGRCTLTVRRPGLRDRTYDWAAPGAPAAEAALEVPVRHGAEQVGTLAVDRVAVGRTPAERRQLLEAVASSLGVVLQAVRAGIELERQLRTALAHASEIASARRRAVAETDSERRRIERDLHDGAQHHLVSLSLALGLVEHELAGGRLEQARAGLDRIAAQIDTVEELLARTASGVTSPVLAKHGLVAALHEELDRDDPPVVLDAAAVAGRRFPAEVEAAAWFCCLEAVNNARKHAAGAPVRVRLEIADDRLLFEVRDDGPGYAQDPGAASPGKGIRNLAMRITAVDGRIDVRSAPGAGTTVRGMVPLPGGVLPPPAARVPAPPVPAAAPAVPAAGPAPTAGLLGQVRTAVRAARDLCHGTAQAGPLGALARALDEPLRIAVVGRSRALGAALAEALADRPDPAPAPVRYLRLEGEGSVTPAVPAADAFVLVLEHPDGEDAGPPAVLRPAQTVGVLVSRSGEPDAPPAPPEPHRLCQSVVPVLVAASAGAAGVRLDDGGVARLRQVVDSRLVARADALKARTALSALDRILGSAPPRPGDRPLTYQLEAIRSGAHQLAELDLLDALCAGGVGMSGDDRRAAERLLGVHGIAAAARLGCAADAGPDELAAAAAAQLARWQRAAARPLSTAADRALAHELVRTCQRVQAAVLAGREVGMSPPADGGRVRQA